MKHSLTLILTLGTTALAQNTLQMDWKAISQKAKGQTVNFFMWGGSDNINRYVDTTVAPELQKLGVKLNRIPITDTVLAVNKVLGEKQAGKNSGGSVDLIWINGENFKVARQAGILLEGWAEKLPNAKYADWKNPSINRDFGYPVNGSESPWGSTQWQYVYDSARVKEKDLPRSFSQLLTYAKAHPGRFTFPAPPTFYGNRLLRMMLVELSGDKTAFDGPFQQKVWDKYSPKLWQYLTELRPHLWRGGETFPADISQQYTLLSNGEVDFAFVQNKAGIQAEVKSGQLPETARVYLFDSGTIADHHYVGIPYNAAHKEGAMVLANLLLRPDLQLKKLDGNAWGDGLAIVPSKVSKTFQQQVKQKLQVGPYTLDQTLLSSKATGDLVADYDKKVQDGFKEFLLK